MIDGKKILAIIPARGGSKGLPRKNIRELCGKPLIGWAILAALQSNYVDRVIVSTDDEEIAEIARREGAQVPFIRPSKYAKDESPSSDAILHAIEFCESNEIYDYLVLLEPTSPLTEATDIDYALKQLMESNAEAIVGITELESYHPEFCVEIYENNKIRKYGKCKFDLPKRRQDLEKVYAFDGSLYISQVEIYKKKKTFYHDNTLGYVSDAWKKYEVDTLEDFFIIETIMKNKNLLRGS